MSTNNLIISDKEYLIAERLSQAYMDEMINSAKSYIEIIAKLINDGVNDDNIKSALIDLSAPIIRFMYEYGEYDFINHKIGNYIDEIDEIDTFLY